jgi:hypothetical protein
MDQKKPMMKVGLIPTLEGDIQGQPEVKEFASFHGLRCYVDIYMPHKISHLKSVLVCPMFVPDHIREERGDIGCFNRTIK